MKNPILYFVLCVFLAACQSDMAQTEVVTVEPSLTFVRTPTVIRTSTPTLYKTPTSAVTMIENIPDWLRDPQQNVLMYRLWDSRVYIGEGGDHVLPALYFYNPDTGDHFELEGPYSDYSLSIRWHNSQQVVLSADVSVIQVLDLAEGTIKTIMETDPLFSEFDVAYIFEPEDEIVYGWGNGTGNNTITILESDTGRSVLFNIGNTLAHDVRLSPDRKYLAVLSGESNEMIWGSHLDLFEYETRSLVLSIDDYDINAINFYPDQSRLVYMRGRDMPCVIDLLSLEKKCIHQIHNAYPDEAIYFRGFLEDRQDLVILHTYFGRGVGDGGICFYDMSSGSLTCPLDGLDVLVDHAITDFILSPDDQYLAAVYEENSPDMDVSTPLGLLVVGRGAGTPIDLGIPVFGHPLLSRAVSWRPLP